MEENLIKILLVDDDPNISELIRLYFNKQGWEIKLASDGNQALFRFKEYKPDLVVLDLMLPGKKGWEVCREIREQSNVPIIMLTARGDREDKIAGLEEGADDYIVKPFDPQELVARVKANLRRYLDNQHSSSQLEVVKLPNLVVDLSQYVVYVNNQQLELTRKEIQLLYFLAAHPNRVFSREQLLERVWGFDYYGETRTVDAHIKRLRQKLSSYFDFKDWEIKTIWGVGYKFEIKQN